ncbi:MAG: metallophosphoesterase [Sedimenticola sp.]
MKLAILHISDIHIRGMSDKVISQASTIASGFYDYARNSDCCLIVITGDIAFSGHKEEYQAALELIINIKGLIEAEIDGREVDIILTPGNHDCTLKPENAARTTIVDQVISNNNLATNNDIVNHCTAAQKEFFEFRNCVTTAEPISDHKLWTEYELNICGHTIRISSVNASWMSRIPESQV